MAAGFFLENFGNSPRSPFNMNWRNKILPNVFLPFFAKASNFYPFIIIKEEHLPCTDAGAPGAPSANAVCCRAVLTHHFTEEVRQLVDNRMFPQNPSQKGEVADFRRVLFCSLNSTLFCFSNAQEKASHAMG